MNHDAATAAPATLDDLTNTLDYTFIDLPELIECSEDDQEFHARQVYPEPAQTQAVQAPQYQLQHPQQQPQPQQQLGAFQQYLSLPYYQQLQQGAQQAAQRPPEVGPLGQAFLSAQQQTTRTVQAQQSHAVFTPQQQQQQQQQQPKQQPWTAAGVAYTLQQQQHLYGQQAVQQGQSLHAGHTIVGAQVQQAAQPAAQAAAADMDEG